MKQSWFLEILEIEKFHEKMVLEFGDPESGRPYRFRDKKGWSIADTAKEFSVTHPVISIALRLARAFHSRPELMNLKTKSQAIKKMKEMN